MKGYGRIRNISVKEGFGFAEFDDRRDADDAVKVIFLEVKNKPSKWMPSTLHDTTLQDLDGKDLDGRRIRVEHTRGNRWNDGDRYGGGRRGGGGVSWCLLRCEW